MAVMHHVVVWQPQTKTEKEMMKALFVAQDCCLFCLRLAILDSIFILDQRLFSVVFLCGHFLL